MSYAEQMAGTNRALALRHALPQVPFALGEVVSIDGDDSIKAVVTTLSISHQGWNVEVQWICNGDLKTAWIAPSRLTLIPEVQPEPEYDKLGPVGSGL